MKKIFISTIVFALLLSACSVNEEKYDELLSYTEWGAFYIKPGDDISSQSFYYGEFLEKLESKIIKKEIVKDTVWDYKKGTEGTYMLKFNNRSCILKNDYTIKATYKINKYEITTIYYPDQEVIEHNSVTDIYITVRKDSLFISMVDNRNGYTRTDKAALDGDNIVYKYKNLATTASYPYEIDESKTYDMTFERDGRNIVFDGDKHLVGVINKELDEIELTEIGTLYKQ